MPENPITKPPNHPITQDKGDPNTLISAVLRAGVLVSFVLLFAGMAWTLALSFASAIPRVGVARSPITGVVNGNVVLLLAGLVALMATPVLRVVTSLWYFAHVGDKRYVVISGSVLIALLASVIVGRLH